MPTSTHQVGSSFPRKKPSSSPLRASDYLHRIGVLDLPPRIAPVDPGYDPLTVESHLEQSAHLMEALKISMACWMIADEAVTRRKVAAATFHNVPTVSGAGPFEIAVSQGQTEAYLDLCADIGMTRVECGSGFAPLRLKPDQVVRMAHKRNLEVQFEMGTTHTRAFSRAVVDQWIEQGHRWLDAGALQLVVKAGENAKDAGLFDEHANLNPAVADQFARDFGLKTVIFEASNKSSQFALLDHFGRDVHLCNVRLEDVLPVEIYRRGLHSEAFQKENLRLPRPARTVHS